MRSWGFSKGHGTQNDFILLRDRTNSTPLSADDVRFLCDRRRGIGADGVIRAVKAEFMPEWEGDPGLWFMDYRNSDGSIAEMCGNGLRVYARFLLDQDYVNNPEMDIATRAGVHHVTELSDGRFMVDLGMVQVAPRTTAVNLAGQVFQAISVNVGNPHAVVLLPDEVNLSELKVPAQPVVDPQVFPSGANVEFVHVVDRHFLQMRVHERGSGETLSCGTGVVASAAAQASRLGEDGCFAVQVPGGDLDVEIDGDTAHLIGPAVIVATGTVLLPDRPRR